MLRVNLQLFAHKKGLGSSKNGRDSESKRLGVKRADGQTVQLCGVSTHGLTWYPGFVSEDRFRQLADDWDAKYGTGVCG